MRTGKRADVIQGVPKRHLYENVIRAMSPEVVVCDELFSDEDYEAVKCFSRAGIKCLASYHAPDHDSIPDKLRQFFNVSILLTDKPKVGVVRSVRRK